MLVLPFFAKLTFIFLLFFPLSTNKPQGQLLACKSVYQQKKEKVFLLLIQLHMYLLGTHFKPGAEQGIKETEFLPFL